MCFLLLSLIFTAFAGLPVTAQVPSWPTVYEEHFDKQAMGWPRYNDTNLTMNIDNGQFIISCRSAKMMVNIPFPLSTQYLDFSLAIKFLFGEGLGEAGILFRYVNPDNYFLVSVSTSGYYRVAKIQAGRYLPIVEHQKYRDFNRNTIHPFKVVARGDNFWFLLNNSMVYHFNDDSFRAGKIFLYASTVEMPELVVKFDDLVLQADLKTQAAATQASSLLALGKQRMTERRFSDAVPLLEKAMELFKDNLAWARETANVCISLAQVHMSLHNYLLAINCYKETLRIVQNLLNRRMEADVLREMGETYSAMGEFTSARSSLEHALAIYNEQSNLPKVSLTLSDLGAVYVMLGDYAIAQSKYNTAKNIAEKAANVLAISKATLGLARCDASTGQYVSCISRYHTAISLLRDANNTPAYIQALMQLGDCQLSFGHHRSAEVTFTTVVDLAKKTGNWQVQASAYLGIGRCKLLAQPPNKAIVFFEQALDLFRKGAAHDQEAQALIDISQYHIVSGEYDKALDSLIAASSLLTQTGNMYTQIQCTVRMGYCLWILGNYSRALSSLKNALQSAEELNWLPGQAMALAMLGTCQEALKQHVNAINTYKQALVIFNNLGDPRGVASISNSLGVLFASVENYKEAIQYYNHALAIYQEGLYPLNKAYVLLNLGTALSDEGEYSEATQYLQQARVLFQDGHDWLGEASTLLNLASIEVLQQSYNHAATLFRTGLQLACHSTENDSRTCNRSIAWRAYDGLGLVFIKQGRNADAVGAWEDAVRLVEETRANLTRASSKLTFMHNKSALYGSLVSLLFGQYAVDDALSYAERAKARTFEDMMETTMIYRGEIMPSALQTASTSLRALNMQNASAQAIALGLNAPLEYPQTPGQSLWASFAAAIQMTQRGYNTILSQLEDDYPVLGSTLSMDYKTLYQHFQYAERNLGQGTVTLEYFVTDDETIVWVITQNGIQTASRIPITRTELTQRVQDFREEIDTQPPSGTEMFLYKKVLAQGQDLYDLLIKPVEDYIQTASHLVIVPSDVLFYLPFSALYCCSGCEGHDLYGGKFLIELYSVSYAPSLSSLYWPMMNSGSGKYESVLSVGNPTGNLANAEVEAKAIASLFPKSTLLLRDKATETAVKDALKESSYDAVHLSTHGLFDTKMPLLSELVFRKGGNDDGNLYAGEILGLPFKTNLVVLSACQTALPPELTQATEGLVVGDELQGLSQALFVAGAPSAVLTLWNVNDVSTSQLMQAMYKWLMKGDPKGEALRQAQISLLQDPTYRHPYYWASFVLYGVWR